jgi:hypothetical protein
MTTIVERTSKGLTEALFDTIDKLVAKKITPEEARAVSHTAKTIIAMGQLELEFRRFVADAGEQKLTSLVIEAPK